MNEMELTWRHVATIILLVLIARELLTWLLGTNKLDKIEKQLKRIADKLENKPPYS